MSFVSFGFGVSDIVNNTQSLVTLLGPVLVFFIGLPIAFYIGSKIKNLFGYGKGRRRRRSIS